jgi:hypothetical protein
VATALLLGVIRRSYATVTGLLQLGVPVRVVCRLEAVDRWPYEHDQQLKHLRQRRGAILVRRAESLEWLDDPPTDRWWRGERIRFLAALDAETLDPTRDPWSLIAAVADDGSDNQWTRRNSSGYSGQPRPSNRYLGLCLVRVTPAPP